MRSLEDTHEASHLAALSSCNGSSHLLVTVAGNSSPFSSIHHCIGVITPSFPPSPRQVTQSKRLAEEEASPQPHKDYSLKEGEKIHINLGVMTHEMVVYCHSTVMVAS